MSSMFTGDTLQYRLSDVGFAYDGAFRARGSLTLAQRSAYGLVSGGFFVVAPQPPHNDERALRQCARQAEIHSRLAVESAHDPSRQQPAGRSRQRNCEGATVDREEGPTCRNSRRPIPVRPQRPQLPYLQFLVRSNEVFIRCVVANGRAYAGAAAWIR
jgi:hypothetical protein